MAGQNIAEEIINEELQEEEIEKDQFLVFSIKDQEFGIQAMRVQEISRVFPATAVPNAPPYVEGILNLRGRLATIINFRKKFEYEGKEADEDTRIVIVDQEGFPVGIVVDAVSEVIKINQDLVQKLPETSATPVAKDYITGIGVIEERLVILLDVDKMLSKLDLVQPQEARQAMKVVKEADQNVPPAETRATAAAPTATETKRPAKSGKGR